jgi:hypothetical protein
MLRISSEARSIKPAVQSYTNPERIQRLRQQRNIIASDFHLSGQQRANQLADLEREVNDL